MAKVQEKFGGVPNRIDMRRSFDGLVAQVKNGLGENPHSGHCFVLTNKTRHLMKILYFDGSEYCIWMKCLDRGQFHGRE